MKIILYLLIVLFYAVNILKVLIISVENVIFVGIVKVKISSKSKTNLTLLENYITIS